MYKALFSLCRGSFISSSSIYPQGIMHRITTTLDGGTKSKSDSNHATFTLGLSVGPYWNRVFLCFSSRLDKRFLLPEQIWTDRRALLRNGFYGEEFLMDSWSRKEGLSGDGGGVTVVDALTNYFRFLLCFLSYQFFLIETSACSRKK